MKQTIIIFAYIFTDFKNLNLTFYNNNWTENYHFGFLRQSIAQKDWKLFIFNKNINYRKSFAVLNQSCGENFNSVRITHK